MKNLPNSSPFEGDDGSADAHLQDLLRAYSQSEISLVSVVSYLATCRVLVPVLSPTVEKDVQMAHKVVSNGIGILQAPDGRSVLPVFTSLDALKSWHAQARPVPNVMQKVALAAVSEYWPLIVLDPSGPVPIELPRPAVWAIAKGQKWVPAIEAGKVNSDLLEELEKLVDLVSELSEVQIHKGKRSEIAVWLFFERGMTKSQLELALWRIKEFIAHSSIVGELVDSLELCLKTAITDKN